MSFDDALDRVIVFGLGGTIAMSDAAAGGVVPTLSAAALVEAIPGLGDSGIDVEVVQFRQLPGASLTPADMLELSDEIGRRADGATGFVITQGTDTIEETSYLLDLVHNLDHPVVVTGAMRSPSMAGADGPANLLAAINLAADPVARGLGCLVVINDEIHAARRVRKQHTTSTSAFASPDGGPIGFVVEGRPRLLNPVHRLGAIPVKSIGRKRIPIYTAALGDDSFAVRALTSQADGLVVAGMGVGHVPSDIVEALAELAAEKPVALASRTGSGSVLRSTYGFAGSERDLIARGLIPAGFLNPLKARILLQVALSGDSDIDTIRQAFAVAGGVGEAEKWPWAITCEKEM
ncbi:L-asparaginase [Nocardia neocaledoniensis NBRC 108232]|uniref:L-asparaginase n=1 Tax=Nocardia neocaledoniensis TaxID=236511 RepID=A0A317NHQ1_9NOCA|nr:asparaginase [Nocardia neocaledoniensis]PWV74413.1 L-asparaginase [Nocardia neocaledoniensis]GEM29092.1 L-asparaginase [Nocardia neocaledoniensis NBRC 108232]